MAAVVTVVVPVAVVGWSLTGGGLNEVVGLTEGLAVEKLVDGIGLVDCDIVVEYDDDIEPVGGGGGELEKVGFVPPDEKVGFVPPDEKVGLVPPDEKVGFVPADEKVGFVPLETDISVYWVRDVVVVVDGVDDTANWPVGLYDCGVDGG